MLWFWFDKTVVLSVNFKTIKMIQYIHSYFFLMKLNQTEKMYNFYGHSNTKFEKKLSLL